MVYVIKFFVPIITYLISGEQIRFYNCIVHPSFSSFFQFIKKHFAHLYTYVPEICYFLYICILQ
jgi:hypothetical protein